MNKEGTVVDPLNAVLVRGAEATRPSRIICWPFWTAMKWPGWEMGMQQWACALVGAVVANLSSGDVLHMQTSCFTHCPSPATPTTVTEAHELREPDLRDKSMVPEVVLYKISVSGAYFTGSNGVWICWPLFGWGPEWFTVQSMRERCSITGPWDYAETHRTGFCEGDGR